MNNKNQKTAIIIGAGPAGLTAAYELLKHTDIKPIIYESTEYIGGISKTINYKGNRMDMGGHRFFSKSDRVMKWWQDILPIENEINHESENILLIKNRLSRIFFLKNFFDYPVSFNFSTIKNLGIFRIFKILTSYSLSRIHPIKTELSLEDFFINKFGKELYKTFFKDYTEKVWGIACSKIDPAWGAQRIKGLSIKKTLIHMFKNIFKSNSKIEQKDTETSLINKFLYPKYGPGQMWEEVLRQIVKMGGEIHTNSETVGIETKEDSVSAIKIKNNNKISTVTGDLFFSTMPIKDLLNGFSPKAPEEILKISNGLLYRDFITVGLLVKKLKIKDKNSIYKKTLEKPSGIISDNWIYIQENYVKIGRLQIFNNWSPFMVKDPDAIWMGLEYFCNKGDEMWNMSDPEFINFAITELEKLNFIDKSDVLDKTLVRVPKAYPAYFGTYNDLPKVKDYINSFKNLFLIGRNGMHKYNNQDHSMLTAMTAVENIKNNIWTKENIWDINAEQEYHESKNK